jgi:hypothetical protein
MLRKLKLTLATVIGLVGAGALCQTARADYVIVQPPRGHVWVWGPRDRYTCWMYARSWSGPGYRVWVTPYNPFYRPRRPFTRMPSHTGPIY